MRKTYKIGSARLAVANGSTIRKNKLKKIKSNYDFQFFTLQMICETKKNEIFE